MEDYSWPKKDIIDTWVEKHNLSVDSKILRDLKDMLGQGPFINHKIVEGEEPDSRFRVPTEAELNGLVIWHFDTEKDRCTWFREKPSQGAIWSPEIPPADPTTDLLELSGKIQGRKI